MTAPYPEPAILLVTAKNQRSKRSQAFSLDKVLRDYLEKHCYYLPSVFTKTKHIAPTHDVQRTTNPNVAARLKLSQGPRSRLCFGVNI